MVSRGPRHRERLSRRLQDLQEAAGFTKYGLARESKLITALRVRWSEEETRKTKTGLPSS